jgi:hypothetical protein
MVSVLSNQLYFLSQLDSTMLEDTQTRSTFSILEATSKKIDLHACNMKFNIQKEDRISTA